MLRISIAVVLATTLVSAQASAASINWEFSEKYAEITGYPAGEDEPDYVFRAACLRGGKVQIGVGAHDDIGADKRGVFSLKLQSGGRSATLSGKSALSKNSEMTGSRELRMELPLADAAQLFAVLSSGRTIQVTGALIQNWTVAGLREKIGAFNKNCSKN